MCKQKTQGKKVPCELTRGWNVQCVTSLSQAIHRMVMSLWVPYSPGSQTRLRHNTAVNPGHVREVKGDMSGLGSLGDQHGLRPPTGRNHQPNGTTELLIIYQTFLKDNMVQRAAHMGWVWFLLDFLASHCPSLTLHPWPQSTWPGTFSLLPSLDWANASSTSNSAKLE